MRLLIAEDDAELGPRLRDRLVREGYAVDLANDGIAVVFSARSVDDTRVTTVINLGEK